MTAPIRNLIRNLLKPNEVAIIQEETQKKPNVAPIPQVEATPNYYFVDSLSKADEPFPIVKSAVALPQGKVQEPVNQVNPYYVDSISKAIPLNHASTIPAKAASVDSVPATTKTTATTGTANSAGTASTLAAPAIAANSSALNPVEPKTRLEIYYEELSMKVDTELQSDDKDYEKLRATIDKVLMVLFRLAAVADQERIFEINVKVKTQAYEIKGTYNRWDGVSITIFSAGVSFVASFASFAPFLPASVMGAETAKILAQGAMQIGTMSTSISGLGSLFSSREEGNRTVYQIYLKKYQDQEEEKRGSKQSKNELVKSAKASSDEFQRNLHESMRAMTG